MEIKSGVLLETAPGVAPRVCANCYYRQGHCSWPTGIQQSPLGPPAVPVAVALPAANSAPEVDISPGSGVLLAEATVSQLASRALELSRAEFDEFIERLQPGQEAEIDALTGTVDSLALEGKDMGHMSVESGDEATGGPEHLPLDPLEGLGSVRAASVESFRPMPSEYGEELLESGTPAREASYSEPEAGDANNGWLADWADRWGRGTGPTLSSPLTGFVSGFGPSLSVTGIPAATEADFRKHPRPAGGLRAPPPKRRRVGRGGKMARSMRE